MPKLSSLRNGFRLPLWLSDKEFACQCRRHGFDPWVRKIPWRGKWQPTPVFLPEKSHGQRNLAGYSPWLARELRHDLVTKQQQRKETRMTCPWTSERWQAVSSTSDELRACYPAPLNFWIKQEGAPCGRITKMTKHLPLLCAYDSAS